jgi:hypothetical protein
MQWDAASSSPGMRIYRLVGEYRGSAGALGHEAIISPLCDTPEGAYSQAKKTTDLIPIYFLMAAVRESLLPTYHSTRLASTSSFATSPSIHPSIHPSIDKFTSTTTISRHATSTSIMSSALSPAIMLLPLRVSWRELTSSPDAARYPTPPEFDIFPFHRTLQRHAFLFTSSSCPAVLDCPFLT